MGESEPEWILLNLSKLSEKDKLRIRQCKKKRLMNNSIKKFKRKILEYSSRKTDIRTLIKNDVDKKITKERVENLTEELKLIDIYIKDYERLIKRLQKEYCSL